MKKIYNILLWLFIFAVGLVYGFITLPFSHTIFTHFEYIGKLFKKFYDRFKL